MCECVKCNKCFDKKEYIEWFIDMNDELDLQIHLSLPLEDRILIERDVMEDLGVEMTSRQIEDLTKEMEIEIRKVLEENIKEV